MSMSNELIIIGGGGHCRDVIWLLRESGDWQILGIVDGSLPRGTSVSGISVIGDESELHGHPGINIVIALGNSRRRATVWNTLKQEFPTLRYPTVIHPKAIVAPDATIGEGTLVTANSVLANNAQIGRQVIINLGCIIGHDTRVGDFATLSPGTILAGNVTVGSGFEFGPGAAVGAGLRLGAWSICGPGAGILSDAPDQTLLLGNPARSIRPTDLPPQKS
jgi:acetyltransferase EpsM